MAGGGAMGMSKVVQRADGSCMNLPCDMAYSACEAAWRAYEASPAGIYKEKALQDLRDSYAVALACFAGHFLGRCEGSSYVTDNELFKLVAILHLSPYSPALPNLSQLESALSEASPNQRFTHRLDHIFGAKWRADLNDVLHTDFVFRIMPHRNSLLPCLRNGLRRAKDPVKREMLRELKGQVADFYQLEEWSHFDWRLHTKKASVSYVSGRDMGAELSGLPWPDDAEDWSGYDHLTVGQALELVRAISKNRVLRALITETNATRLISRFMAILDCTEHARLWLIKSELPVYYTIPDLTYAKLWEEEEVDSYEPAFRSSLGFGARVPSPVDKYLRRVAYDCCADLPDDGAAPGPLTEVPERYRSGSNIDFSRLKVARGYGNDIEDEPWAEIVEAISLLSKCEPLDKLSYLLPTGASAEKHVSGFVKAAYDTTDLPWRYLLV